MVRKQLSDMLVKLNSYTPVFFLILIHLPNQLPKLQLSNQVSFSHKKLKVTLKETLSPSKVCLLKLKNLRMELSCLMIEETGKGY